MKPLGPHWSNVLARPLWVAVQAFARRVPRTVQSRLSWPILCFTSKQTDICNLKKDCLYQHIAVRLVSSKKILLSYYNSFVLTLDNSKKTKQNT
jgi:hypothetical protein